MSENMEILGEHIIIKKGKIPIKLSDEKSDNFIYPYVDIKAFEKGSIARYTDGVKCLICEDNDILIVWDGARCGYVGKAINGAVGSTLAIIKSKENFDKDFLFYFLKSNFNYFNTKVKGIGIPHLDPFIVHHSRLIIPPLPEQHRIVAKIEALFSSLDKGIESLKTAQQQLKVYRQAVLKWAFEGKLTNENVKDGELPEGWKWVKIGDISHKVTVGYVGPMKEQYIEFGVPFLRGQNVRPNKYDSNHLKYISNDFNELLSKSKIYPGDVLVVRSGNVGISCVVPEILSEANCADLVIIKKTLNTNSYYISYYLNSVIQSRILAQKVGVALEHFNTKTVERFEIPFPKIEEQHAIVSEIESRLSVCDKLEESITYSLKQAEALRQSVLKKAFSGKLVPQDPNDAPASVLLERIKAEKEKNMPDKKVKLKKVKN